MKTFEITACFHSKLKNSSTKSGLIFVYSAL